MNRSQGQPLRNMSNMPTANTQQRGAAPTSRIVASKSGAWGTTGAIGTQPREGNGPNESWSQVMNPRSTNPIDFSSSSFPSLAAGGSQSHSLGSALSQWQSGPPAQETQRSQTQNPRVIQQRQPPLSSSRDGVFSVDSFSRTASSRLDDYSNPEQSSTRRSSAAPSDRFPPGLVPRSNNQLSDSLSNDPSRVTSPTGAPPGLTARSPLSGLNGSMLQDQQNQQSPPPSAVLGKDSLAGISRDLDPNGTGGLTQPQSPNTLLNSMSERDKWGLPGWHAIHDGPNAELRALSRGQDLNALGMSADPSTPLLRTYPGPFAPPGAYPPRPLESDYTIPDCYIVQNVAPIQQRISGFTEDTLFYIFYTSPKDIIQEEVATELMSRKWRFHMKEKMWLTRDDTTAAPVILEKDVCEQGYYIWWDWRNWKRARRAYTLRYEDLDDHLSGVGRALVAPTAGAPGVAMNGTGVGSVIGTQGPGSGAGMGVGVGGFNAVPGLERMVRGF